MSLTALLCVIAAAALHAGWNLIVKRVEDRQLFTWWALAVGTALYCPLLLRHLPLPKGIWPYAVASALVEAAYFMALIHAYGRGDFSLVYPVARGASPALLAVWAALVLGEAPQRLGMAGLALLLLGLIIVGGGGLWTQRRTAILKVGGLVPALGVALCISIYSVIDGAAVRLMAPAAYTVLVFGLTVPCITPLVLAHYGPSALAMTWRAYRVRIIAAGILMLLAYMLVVQAYALARVSYVGALREVSVVFAALVGWLWLKESFGAMRTAGAVLIVLGMLIIAMAGE
jgi:drug/metabolite transporter (DMT)-like permease